ncbi:general stress protein [Auritidibacter ignavus]|uniref:general stress protein n=1 Tax=Auritidibacter ignavus TaxID=678932 RepID=UPI000F0259E0|nr:general stress protein [Auritidibacter ignavus]NIH71575.1 hypothetical protein [Auritidibacter ignavus]WGH86285.1 hypothetical protein QDX24_00180 [Auritidibacter ignavus]WGH88569.1 hypothetical protein QDX22_00180 [Auritidibacter ignavus]
MSMNAGFTDPLGQGLPQGQLLGNYRHFDDAQKVVDRLVEAGINVDHFHIVGRDVRLVTSLRNRSGYPAVVGRAALQGAFFGLLIGLLISTLMPAQAPFQILASVALGVGVWVIFGVIGHALRRRAGKYDYIPRFAAVSFDLLCDFAVAHQAKQIIGPQPMPTSPTPAHQPDSTGTTAPGTPPPSGQTGSSPTTAQTPVQEPSEASTTRSGFPDLPDGRPQFGARIDDASQPRREAEPHGDASADPSAPSEPSESSEASEKKATDGTQSSLSEQPEPRRKTSQEDH